MFEEFSITVLRAFARANFEECRGAGKLGNVGTKSDISAYLIEHGKTADDVAEFATEYNEKTAAPAAPVPAVGAPADVLGAVEALKSAVMAALATPKTEAPKIDETQIEQIAENVYKRFNPVQVVEVKRVDGSAVKLEKCHKAVPAIIQAVGAGIHALLVGPAGSGKTTAGENVAAALNVPFYPVSLGPQTTKSDLLGFIDAMGNYRRTAVRDAFENGGLLLLDEIDASNAGVLTCINALLANGYCSFPDGVIKKNDNFRCMAAANTFGRGADRQYVGRAQLDAATLDRFKYQTFFDYDENLELDIVRGIGSEVVSVNWCKHVQALRHAADNLKMRVVISPRASIAGAKLLALGMNYSDVENAVIFGGIPTEQVEKIKGAAKEN